MSGSDKNKLNISAQNFDAPGSEQASDTNGSVHNTLPQDSVGRWWHSQFNLMLTVFALLAVAALLFVTLSPSPSSQSQNVKLVKQDGSISAKKVLLTEPEAAPWDEKRRAQARTDSQTILSGLLNSKKNLEAKGVKEWAFDSYQQALELADQGDQFYKQQDYRSAIERYQSAAQQMDNLGQRLPAIIDENIRQGLDALGQGKSSLAKQKFQQALTLDANSIAALAGLGRAENLDQVLDYFADGQQFEQHFLTDDLLDNIDNAKVSYQKAHDLDDKYKPAQEAIERVSGLIEDKKFRQFMSKGFIHLFSKQYSSSQKAFSNALKIKPNDITAKGAYSQSLASNRSASLSSLLGVAKQQEANEQWSQALANYQVVLQRDSNQVSAKLGQIRARARDGLDTRLENVLSDPLSLVKTSINQKAQNALRDARAILKKGPRLEKQIRELELAMSQLGQNIKFVFSSDEETQITLIKAGAKKIELGKFKTKNLALKPGRYVIRGVRLGYQDVRKEIEVLPEMIDVQSLFIRCTEPIDQTAENAFDNVKIRA